MNNTLEQNEADYSWELYKQICESIRETDRTSFNLLRTVPLVASIGSFALTVLEKSVLSSIFTEFSVIGLALLGMSMTFGLYVWELRNIQKCSWLVSRAAKLETHLFKESDHCQYHGMADVHFAATKLKEIKIASLRDRPWGKTQAEKLIYISAILVWLIPAVLAFLSLLGNLVRLLQLHN